MSRRNEAIQGLLLRDRPDSTVLPPVKTLLIHDTFTDANGTEIKGRAPDTVNVPGSIWDHIDDPNRETIEGNEFSHHDQDDTHTPINIDTGHNNRIRASCVVRQVGAPQGAEVTSCGPFIRGKRGYGGHAFLWFSDGTIMLTYYTYPNGVLATASYAAQVGDTFLVRAQGNKISGWINGVKYLEAESGYRSNADYSHAGIWSVIRRETISGPQYANIIDDFKVERD